MRLRLDEDTRTKVKVSFLEGTADEATAEDCLHLNSVFSSCEAHKLLGQPNRADPIGEWEGQPDVFGKDVDELTVAL